MYIQTPWVRVPPPPGGTEQGRGPSPHWPGRGGSEAISKGRVSPGTGTSCHSCLCFPNPKRSGVGAEQGEGGQGP